MSYDSDQATRRAIEALRHHAADLARDWSDSEADGYCKRLAGDLRRIAADLEAALPKRREFVCDGCGRTVGDSDTVYATSIAFYCEQCAAEKRAAHELPLGPDRIIHKGGTGKPTR